MGAATVGFIGVDESSLVLATKLLSYGYAVKAYEVLISYMYLLYVICVYNNIYIVNELTSNDHLLCNV